MNIDLLLTGAAIAASGTVLFQLKTVPKKLFDKLKGKLIYSVKIYQYDELFDMVEAWLQAKHESKYNDVEACIGDINNNPSEYKSLTVKSSTIKYKHEETIFVIKYKNKKILIAKSKEKLDKAGSSIKDLFFRKYIISGIRCKKEVNELLEEIVQFSKIHENKNIVRVYTNTQYGDWECPVKIFTKPLEKTVLNSLIKNTILSDLNDFEKSENWYLNTSIPYKRGFGFYGPPGTGKTTLALAIANTYRKSVYCLNLNCIQDDSRLPYCFRGIKDDSILLIEDIDKVFSGRDNAESKGKVAFSTFLNCLDGASYKHGLITIITTNHLEKLDDALIRTGRIDNLIEIPKPSDKEISEYFTLFYETPIEIKGTFNLTMSDIQEICIKNKNNSELAIKKLYNEKI